MRALNLTPEQKKERARASRLKWNAANPEKVREQQRRAYAVRVGHEPRQHSPKAPRKGRTATLTPEEAKARARARARAWIKSPAGRAYALTQREKNRERGRRYRATPEGAAKKKAYTARTKDIQRERHRKWRESQPDYKEKKRAYMLVYNATHRIATPEARERVRRNGRNSYARMMADPVRHAKMLEWSRNTYNRLKADPVRYAEYKVKQRRMIEQRRLRSKPAYAQSMMENIMRMIPRSLHPELREDLRNDFVRDILAGELTVEQIPLVMKTYAAAARKMLHNDFEFSSLDDVIPGTDNLKRIDTIAAGTSIYTAVQYKRGRKAKRPST